VPGGDEPVRCRVCLVEQIDFDDGMHPAPEQRPRARRGVVRAVVWRLRRCRW
jgi:hypothetical protein